jgi:hypothetical protein
MQFIPLDEPRIRPTPPATVQLREPILIPEAARDGEAVEIARVLDNAKAAPMLRKNVMTIVPVYSGEAILSSRMSR